MLQGIDYLDNDPDTDVIVLVSKPPYPDTAAKIYRRVATCKKPVVIDLLGGKAEEVRGAGAYAPESLEQAADMAASGDLEGLAGLAKEQVSDNDRAQLEALYEKYKNQLPQ